MSNAQHKPRDTLPILRSDDPNIAQQSASHPDHSVWVGASAGAGKTKVLTDRVLRLLLPRDDGRAGTPAHKILCLTFTKAAANEMALRLNKILGQWAVISVTELRAKIEALTGDQATDYQVEQAQKLFADVIDCPGGLQIMTIHSFCQSVLGRFPMEAGLSPDFQVMDEYEGAKLLSKAINVVLKRAQAPETSGSDLANAVQNIVSELDEERFLNELKGLCSERRQLLGLFSERGGAQGIFARICSIYEIDQNVSVADITQQLCAGGFDEPALRRAIDAMAQDSGKMGPIAADGLRSWLNADFSARCAMLGAYRSVFLTSENTIKVRGFPPKSALDIYPQCREVLEAEAQRLLKGDETLKRVKSASLTRDLLIVGHNVLQAYEAEKKRADKLDFDDMILRTMALLSGKTISFETLQESDVSRIPDWIMYKLDQGLDHVLVDEAQDTNPEQWQIIEALCADFFSGQSAREDVMRTSFTVGDIKQSIYSFQRAAPEEFQRMQRVFHEKVSRTGLINKNIGLDISFRTTKSVLALVDQVFAPEYMRKAVGSDHVEHIAFRAGQAGKVALWPVFESPDDKKQRDFWDPPVQQYSVQSAAARNAEYIAEKISGWLQSGEILPSADRPIQAGDIMILVRSRTAFVDQLVRALKLKNVPVSGVDRMVVGDQLVVQDALSLLRFCLLSDDDLSLAEVLKSPLIGLNEEELFALSYNRKGSLWQELCNFDAQKMEAINDKNAFVIMPDLSKLAAIRDYLSRLMGRARYMGAFEFFSHVFHMPCPASDVSALHAVRGRLGDDALDALDELFNAALNFRNDHIDHLQNFLETQENQRIEVKREMDEQGGQVRIMTVHGSKGLQAPIVILPDTLRNNSAKKSGRFLWPHRSGLDVPLFAARKDVEPSLYSVKHQAAKSQSEEEEMRLLYVAMTRAADQLYIGGHINNKSRAKEDSWYFLIEDALSKMADVVEEDGLYTLENPQNAAPDQKKAVQQKEGTLKALPDWARMQAPAYAMPMRPYMPSRPSEEEEEVAASPLQFIDGKRFLRGNITHKLLQFLPDFDADNRRAAAVQYVAKNAFECSAKVQQSIVDEVLSILENPEYAPFFAAGSMAEVPITGVMNNEKVISGQIDRLVVSENDVWVLDFKTNRPPPKKVEDVAPIYHKQMAAYRETIAQIYPNRTIHTALLWTDGPYLMLL